MIIICVQKGVKIYSEQFSFVLEKGTLHEIFIIVLISKEISWARHEYMSEYPPMCRKEGGESSCE